MRNIEFDVDADLYLARNRDGRLYLFLGEPCKNFYGEWVEDDHDCSLIAELDPALFPSVKWEDQEATKVDLILSPKTSKS